MVRHADTSHGRPPEPAPDPAAADAAAQGGRAARDHLGRGGASRARRVAGREDGGVMRDHSKACFMGHELPIDRCPSDNDSRVAFTIGYWCRLLGLRPTRLTARTDPL